MDSFPPEAQALGNESDVEGLPSDFLRDHALLYFGQEGSWLRYR